MKFYIPHQRTHEQTEKNTRENLTFPWEISWLLNDRILLMAYNNPKEHLGRISSPLYPKQPDHGCFSLLILAKCWPWRIWCGNGLVSSNLRLPPPRTSLGNSRSKESKILDQSPVFCQAPRMGMLFFLLVGRGGGEKMFFVGVLEVRTYSVFVVGSGGFGNWIHWKVTDPRSKTQIASGDGCWRDQFWSGPGCKLNMIQRPIWNWALADIFQETHISYFGERKNIFRNELEMDILVPWSVYKPAVSCLFMVGSWRFFFK